MKTLVFVGPPGSGKTTLAGHTFRSSLLVGKKIYIINDDGDGSEGTVDAGILQGIEGLNLNALTAGCIGCKDEAEFRDAIRKILADRSVDWLVVEPVGYAAGNEVPDILHSLGVHATVICLVDVANFSENLMDGFMSTQVKAASVVGLTKYGEVASAEDPALENVLAFIGEHNSEASVLLLPPGAMLPEWVLSHQPRCRHQEHYHCHGHHDHGHHHHDHDHVEIGDHGVFSIHVKLRSETTYTEIQRTITTITGIFRGKGVVEGKQWHLVQKTWESESERLTDNRVPFATFYSREPISVDDLLSIAVPVQDIKSVKTAYEILRSSTASNDEEERRIRKRLAGFPKEAFTNRFGDLVTHPEILSTTKTMAFQFAQREGVSREVFVEMIRACTRYWLSATVLIRSRDWENGRAVDEWQRRLGIALGWFGWNTPNEVGIELMTQVIAARPAHLMCQGLATRNRLHSDSARAKIQVEEIHDVLKFGLKSEGMSKQKAFLALSYCFVVTEEERRDNLSSELKRVMTEIKTF